LIENSTFAISLSIDDIKHKSTIEFGSYNRNFLNQTKFNFSWLYIRSRNSIWWELDFSEAKYGSHEIELSV